MIGDIPQKARPSCRGVSPYLNILSEAKNLSFSDINSHWAKSEILEITALDYMDGQGDKFYPNRHLNYGEVLTTVIRAVGKEGDAQKASPNNHQKGIYEIAYKMELIPKPESEDNNWRL